MPEFRVRIEIDVDAEHELLAAIDAWQLLSSPAAQSPVVDVWPTRSDHRDTNEAVRIDLDQHFLGSQARVRKLKKLPVRLPDGSRVELSPGVHNELQKLVVEEFAPRFAPASAVVYLGDTAQKRLVISRPLLAKLRIAEPSHDKLPDVVLFDKRRNWLFLIEAVTSHGPESPKRHAELEAGLAGCPASRVYVTAFTDFAAFKKYAAEIVWESEVWIAEFPDHMIHFNGDKFLGPYPSRKRRRKEN